MESTISKDKEFSTWARQTCVDHPDVLEHMLKSINPLEKAIAIRIIKNAEACEL